MAMLGSIYSVDESTELPCWVWEMTNEEAYLQLGFGNAQGEWKPIEIGLHALGLPEAEGGRGKKGGLREYARQMGKAVQNVSTYKQGAEVLSELKNCHINMTVYLDKAQHLAAIHKTPKELWPTLAEWAITPKEMEADL
jgi:hypothetical protein